MFCEASRRRGGGGGGWKRCRPDESWRGFVCVPSISPFFFNIWESNLQKAAGLRLLISTSSSTAGYICSLSPGGIQLGFGLRRTIQRRRESEVQDEWERERRGGGKRIISAFINPTCLAHTVPEVSGCNVDEGTEGPDGAAAATTTAAVQLFAEISVACCCYFNHEPGSRK